MATQPTFCFRDAYISCRKSSTSSLYKSSSPFTISVSRTRFNHLPFNMPIDSSEWSSYGAKMDPALEAVSKPTPHYPPERHSSDTAPPTSSSGKVLRRLRHRRHPALQHRHASLADASRRHHQAHRLDRHRYREERHPNPSERRKRHPRRSVSPRDRWPCTQQPGAVARLLPRRRLDIRMA